MRSYRGFTTVARNAGDDRRERAGEDRKKRNRLLSGIRKRLGAAATAVLGLALGELGDRVRDASLCQRQSPRHGDGLRDACDRGRFDRATLFDESRLRILNSNVQRCSPESELDLESRLKMGRFVPTGHRRGVAGRHQPD